MIYLDTHVVAWLHHGKLNRFTARGLRLIERETLKVAPVVALELEYLYEIGRVSERSAHVLQHLSNRIGLAICDRDPIKVITRACDLAWTRDLFDRMIVAQAAIGQDPLLTCDADIREHYPKARW